MGVFLVNEKSFPVSSPESGPGPSAGSVLETSWLRPCSQSCLLDGNASELVFRAAGDQTVARLTLQELQEVFQLSTPLKHREDTSDSK